VTQLETIVGEFARATDARHNAAFDLWTWLPSHKAATLYHGDYACNHQPDMAAIMEEASGYIAGLLDPERKTEPYWDEGNGYHDGCPCGESHEKEPKCE